MPQHLERTGEGKEVRRKPATLMAAARGDPDPVGWDAEGGEPKHPCPPAPGELAGGSSAERGTNQRDQVACGPLLKEELPGGQSKVAERTVVSPGAFLT